MRRERRLERRLEGRSSKSRLLTGVLLLGIGGALLLQKMDTGLPQWLFTWPVLLIVLGLFSGVRQNFRGPGWIMMTLVGAAFLTTNLYPQLSLKQYIFPGILIIIGIAFLFRPRKHSFGEHWGKWDDWKKNDENDDRDNRAYNSDEERLEVVSIFGGTKKIILSKDFKGGEAVSFLGGTELNLSQADINGRVVLELTQVLGGTKLIVPSHWDIRPELVSVFGGIEDKRQLTTPPDPTKILVLKGTSVFGGIEIRSY